MYMGVAQPALVFIVPLLLLATGCSMLVRGEGKKLGEANLRRRGSSVVEYT